MIPRTARFYDHRAARPPPRARASGSERKRAGASTRLQGPDTGAVSVPVPREHREGRRGGRASAADSKSCGSTMRTARFWGNGGAAFRPRAVLPDGRTDAALELRSHVVACRMEPCFGTGAQASRADEVPRQEREGVCDNVPSIGRSTPLWAGDCRAIKANYLAAGFRRTGAGGRPPQEPGP